MWLDTTNKGLHTFSLNPKPPEYPTWLKVRDSKPGDPDLCLSLLIISHPRASMNIKLKNQRKHDFLMPTLTDWQL